MEYRLSRLVKKTSKNGGVDGLFKLEFENQNGPKSVLAKKVILAVPVDVLKKISIESPRYSGFRKLDFSEFHYGSVYKIFLYFDEKVWRKHFTGTLEFVTDKGAMVYEASRKQEAEAGSLFIYGNLEVGDDAKKMADLANSHIDMLEKYIPDLRTHYLGAQAFLWHKAYSGILYAGEDDVPIHDINYGGGLYIVGSAMSAEDQGYMNGAVSTAIQAAKSIAPQTCQNLFFQ